VKNKIKIRFFYLCLITAVLTQIFSGCGKMPAVDYISYRADSFLLDGRFKCGELEYSLELEYKKDGALTVKIIEPERIAGCTITLDTNGCASLTFGGITLELAKDAESLSGYGILASLRDLVLPSPEGLISAKVTKLGGQTYNLAVFSCSRGDVSVWFDRDGVPVRFEADSTVLSVTSFSKLVSST
jgi:hypothetical protein